MDLMQELKAIKAVFIDKHFIYTSGKHGINYVNMDIASPHVDLIAKICDELVKPFAGQFDTVAAPATGGIIFAVLAAYGSKTKAVWADKDGKGGFEFERAGFAQQIKGKRVLVLEDIMTTGGSTEKVCREVEKVGGDIVGVSVVGTYGRATAESLGVPRLEALMTLSFPAYEPEDCVACRDNVPIAEDIGHGDDYKAENPDYPGGYVKLQEA